MNVMLLAAGEGTRLRPHTLILPKPAMPFLNAPLASYPLAFLEDLKLDHLVVNTFHLPTKIVDLFMHMNHGARKLYFSHEVTQILGSGGGLGAARDYFKNQDELVMMNADEVILPLEKGVFAKALAQHRKNKAFCTLLTMEHDEVGTKFGGVWLDKNQQVMGFGKTAPSEDAVQAEHFIGVQILSTQVFDYLPTNTPANILYDAVAKAIAEGHKVERYPVPCHWFETGNATDFLQATEACLKILAAPRESHPQAHLRHVLSTYGSEKPILDTSSPALVLKTASTRIEPQVRFSGFAVLGPHSVIQSSAQLTNVVVAEKTKIAADTHAVNQIFLENN